METEFYNKLEMLKHTVCALNLQHRDARNICSQIEDIEKYILFCEFHDPASWNKKLI